MLAACAAMLLIAGSAVRADGPGHRGDATRAAIGLDSAEQDGLDLQRKSAQIGLGSYLATAAGCNDCHTWPNYAPNHDPFARQPRQVNVPAYMAGGRLFATPGGNFCSRNISPAPGTSMPAGLSEEDFLYVIQTGCDPQDEDFRDPARCELLQVMPWPEYRKLTNSDLRAIYAYLSVLPHTEPGPAAQCQPDPQGVRQGVAGQ
jgi:hypothetical protein